MTTILYRFLQRHNEEQFPELREKLKSFGFVLEDKEFRQYQDDLSNNIPDFDDDFLIDETYE